MTLDSSGNATFAGNVDINKSDPAFYLYNGSQTSGNKRWKHLVTGTSYINAVRDDSDSTGTTYLQIDRTSNVVDTITFRTGSNATHITLDGSDQSTTFAGDALFNGSTGSIYTSTSGGSLAIAGGSASNAGGNIILRGESHSTEADYIKFRNGTTDAVVIDGSQNATFAGDVTASQAITASASTAAHTTARSNGTFDIVNVINTTGGGANLASAVLDIHAYTTGANVRLAATDAGSYGADFVIETHAANSTADDVTAERMRITSSGNVGIGTDSPESLLHLIDTSNPSSTTGSLIIEGRRDGGANVLTLRAKDASAPTVAIPNGQGPVIRFQGFDGTDFGNMAYIYARMDGTTAAAGDMPTALDFATSPDGTETASVALTLDSSQNATFAGAIGVNGATPNASIPVALPNQDYVAWYDSGTSGGTAAYIRGSGGELQLGGSSYRFDNAVTTTFAGTIKANANINLTDDDSGLNLSGGSSTTSGGNIVLYGGSHATQAGDIVVRSGSTARLKWDQSIFGWQMGAATAAYPTNSASLWVNRDGGTLPTLHSSGPVAVFSNTSATTDDAIVHIVSGTAANARIDFGDTDGISRGYIDYDNNTDGMVIGTSATSALTLDSSQNATFGSSTVGVIQAAQFQLRNNAGSYGANDGLHVFQFSDSHTYLDNHDNGGFVFRTNPTTEMARLDSDGLKFNGDTAAANGLSDYEEGTWTPNVGGSATYTAQNGSYVKVGNHVTCAFDILINTIGTGSATILYGFPFTVDNTAQVPVSGTISFHLTLNTAVYELGFYVINNTTYAYFTGHTGSSANSNNVVSVFKNGARIIGSVTYRTA
ncbi:MAG: hypothetical protein VW496_00295 [Pelagibacteraceae bacterium]